MPAAGEVDLAFAPGDRSPRAEAATVARGTPGYPVPVTATRPESARPGLVGQLGRFVAVGALSALVDFGIYHALLGAGLWVHAAKAVSFICGTTTAYLLNRRFTFDSAGGRARLAGFMLLYGTTFALNVGMNALMLAVLPAGTPLRVSLAWVIAQGTATAVNFVMLRTVVFRR
jgi:putative flippase GtrA